MNSKNHLHNENIFGMSVSIATRQDCENLTVNFEYNVFFWSLILCYAQRIIMLYLSKFVQNWKSCETQVSGNLKPSHDI